MSFYIDEKELIFFTESKKKEFNKLDNGFIYYFILGNIFSHNEEELINFIVNQQTDRLKRVIGDFFIVVFDSKNKSIFVCTDRGGQTLAFFSLKNGFRVSDNLWDLARNMNLSIEDIDIQSIKEIIVFNTSLDNSTIFKDIFLTTPATLIKYNLNSKKYSNERYWEFRFSNSIIKSTNEKIELFDYEIDNAFKKIFSVNEGSVKYGTAISGGFDSRLIPYYAKKNNVNLTAFIIGESKPYQFFFSNDHTKAIEISKYYDLKLQFIEYNSLNLFSQMKIDVNNFPYYSSDLFKIISHNDLNFDVLLTGASGYWIGGGKLFSDEIKKNDFYHHFFKYLSNSVKKVSYEKSKKAFNFLFNTQFNVEPIILNQGIHELMNKEEMECANNKLILNIERFGEMSNFELFFNLEHFTIGHRNKNGSYESISGNKKSFTPYSPFLIDFVENLSQDDLINRNLFEQFINVKFPKLASIGGQKYTSKINKQGKKNILDKLSSLSSFVFRGNGCTDYYRWSKKQVNKNFIEEVLNTELGLLDDIFDRSGLLKKIKDKKYDFYLLLNLLKMIEIIIKIYENSTNGKKLK